MKRITLIFTIIVFAMMLFGNEGYSQKEILFEDYFCGDNLAEHWEVNIRKSSFSPLYNARTPARYHIEDCKLIINAPRGDTYFDLKGYSLEGNFTIEVKFSFSSLRSATPGNFGIYFHRPEDYISWWDSDGIMAAVRRIDSRLSFIESQIIDELLLEEQLWGTSMYDSDHVIRIEIKEHTRALNKVYMYLNDIEITTQFGGSGLLVARSRHGGFSFTIYDSIVSVDYVKMYR